MSQRDARQPPAREILADINVYCLGRADAAALFHQQDIELEMVKKGLPLGHTPDWLRGEAGQVPPHQLDMKHVVSPKRSGRLLCSTTVYVDRSKTGRISEPAPPTLRALPKPTIRTKPAR